MNLEDLKDRAEQYRRDGWTVLPKDEPEIGSMGYVAYRATNDGEDQVTIKWYIFGKPLLPEVKVYHDPSEFESDFRRMLERGRVSKCGDPKNRLIGFVQYHPDQGKSKIIRLPMLKMHDLSSEILESTGGDR